MESMLPQFLPPPPPECKWSDSAFCEAIVHRNGTIGKKNAQELFLIEVVLKAFVGIASVRNLWHSIIFYPRKEVINFWFYDKLTVFCAFFVCTVATLVIQMEYFRNPLYCLGGDRCVHSVGSSCLDILGKGSFCVFLIRVIG